MASAAKPGSIGAVSHARLLSRTAGSDAAYEIFNRAARSRFPRPPRKRRHTVEIRNLFFNTPARRKFVKGVLTEFGHISEWSPGSRCRTR